MTPPSLAARRPAPGCRAGSRLEAATAAAVGQITSALQSLGPHEAETALAEAVPITCGGRRGSLRNWRVTCRPIPTPSTRAAPSARQPFCGWPRAAPGRPLRGPSRVRHCGAMRTDLRQLRRRGGSAGRVIPEPPRTCARCHRDGQRIAARRPEGPICHACYSADPATFEECAGAASSGIRSHGRTMPGDCASSAGSARCTPARCAGRPRRPLSSMTTARTVTSATTGIAGRGAHAAGAGSSSASPAMRAMGSRTCATAATAAPR